MFSLNRFTKICTEWPQNIPEPLQAIPVTLNEPKLSLLLGYEAHLYRQLQNMVERDADSSY